MLEPKILLLDEPFASLDQHLRERLREEVRDLQQRLEITTLFVTHGQDEALALADRIVVMRDGRTEQIAPPDVALPRARDPLRRRLHRHDEPHRRRRRRRPLPPRRLRAAGPGPGRPRDPRRPPRGARHRPADGDAAASIHRVTDYGTHAIVDIELPDGARLKSMVPDARAWAAGTAGRPRPRAPSPLYRDDAAIHRSG